MLTLQVEKNHFMLKISPIYLIAALVIGCAAASCNDDEQDSYSYSDPLRNSVMISGFNLQADDSILTNLDSVYFTIDLDKACIFNADSLPRGTKVDRLIPVISLPACRKAEITMPGSTGADTVVNYLTNSTDSINFSRGSVKLHIVSLDEDVECTYTIYVNVHRMAPDSLAWGNAAWAPLPVSASTAAKAVKIDETIYLFEQTAASTSRSVTSDIAARSWTTTQVSLPAGARLDQLTACGNDMYILDAADALYKSSDFGESWSATGTSMSHIYGAYGNIIAGVQSAAGGSYMHVTYPATVTSPVADECPVSGTSEAILYTTEWSTKPLMILVGGRCADGSLTGSSWAFDGTSWAPASISPMAQVEGAVMVPYFAYSQKSNWTLTKRSILLAMGGRTADGINNRKVYLSYDMGVHWAEAPVSMQLPADIPALYGASALLANTTYTSRAASVWNEIALPRLAPWYIPVETPASRATDPITSWDCPFIYLFGGNKPDGSYNDRIYRAVINRLMFKPLQ